MAVAGDVVKNQQQTMMIVGETYEVKPQGRRRAEIEGALCLLRREFLCLTGSQCMKPGGHRFFDKTLHDPSVLLGNAHAQRRVTLLQDG